MSLISGIISSIATIAWLWFLIVTIVGAVSPKVFADKKTGAIPERAPLLVRNAVKSFIAFLIAGVFHQAPNVQEKQQDDKPTQTLKEGIKTKSTAVGSVKDNLNQSEEEVKLQINTFFQSESDGIKSVSVTRIMFDQNGKPIDRPLFYAEVTIEKEFTWGGAQDWNGLASMVSQITKKAVARGDIGRIRYKVIGSTGIDWAYIDFMYHKLPENINKMTYLEIMSFANDVSGGTTQANNALCDFYEKYGSAKPRYGRPPTCKQNR